MTLSERRFFSTPKGPLPRIALGIPFQKASAPEEESGDPQQGAEGYCQPDRHILAFAGRDES